jgi:hypothetical protein
MNTIATTTTVTPSTPNPKQPQQRQTAKEMIAANVKCLIEQLEAGRSDALTAYLNAMSRFHNYSFGNILEIARQRSDATRVAGLWSWNQLGRKVKKGEKGIRILAPIIGVRRKTDEEAEKDPVYQNKAALVGFRHTYVPAHPLGEGKRKLWRFLEQELLDWVEAQECTKKRPPASTIKVAISAHARRTA